ncbi:MAG TPA: hypothetical protein VMT99_00145 [Candidatus Paceibacterota bacterium]|nr:hypothetical protein [Candidatus Paceibacterota bacterium]
MEENKKAGLSDREIAELVAKIADELCEMALLLVRIMGENGF